MILVLHDFRIIWGPDYAAHVTTQHDPDALAAILDLYLELLAYNRRTAHELGISDTDLAVLDLIHRGGTITPTELARRTDTHPATMTGILNRLEEGGWILRERPQADRRAVSITFRPDREDLIGRHYAKADSAVRAVGDARGREAMTLVTAYLEQITAAVRQSR